MKFFKIIIILCCFALCACSQTQEEQESENIKVVIYGDSQSNDKVHKEICKLTAFLKPDAVIHAGDIVDEYTHLLGPVAEKIKRGLAANRIAQQADGR